LVRQDGVLTVEDDCRPHARRDCFQDPWVGKGTFDPRVYERRDSVEGTGEHAKHSYSGGGLLCDGPNSRSGILRVAHGFTAILPMAFGFEEVAAFYEARCCQASSFGKISASFSGGFLRVADDPARDFLVAVGAPVTRRPPNRSRRAVFPHRALRSSSLPRSTSTSQQQLPVSALRDPGRCHSKVIDPPHETPGESHRMASASTPQQLPLRLLALRPVTGFCSRLLRAEAESLHPV